MEQMNGFIEADGSSSHWKIIDISLRRCRRLQKHLSAVDIESQVGISIQPTNAIGNVAAGIGLSVAARYVLPVFARQIAANHRGPEDLHGLISSVEKTSLKVAVIGMGISGTQAMKACLAEGIEPFGFEYDKEIGGFWNYKESLLHPSVYRSTHIDTDRDMNSFGDRPWDPEKPLLIHNSELKSYLEANHKEFGLTRRVRFNTKVLWVTPTGEAPYNKWLVTFVGVDPLTGETVNDTKVTETFDGVMICTGRHGGGGFIPNFPGLDDFKGFTCHSSKYKYPEKHNLVAEEGSQNKKTVVVVGIGNSGCDIVTEIGMKNQTRGRTILVCRSGCHVAKTPHMEELMSTTTAMDRGTLSLFQRLPWHYADAITHPLRAKNQAILNRYGMKPKHRASQQHLIASGLAGQVSLHTQLENGWIEVKRGIESFTENGIIFRDANGNVENFETPVDSVIFATGYRQQAGFVDPSIVDMRWEREGNDVPLWKGCLPITAYKGLGFINFVQSATFMCAELQSRLYTRVLKGLIEPPSLEEQRSEMERTRNALAAKYIDRSQLRVQHGVDIRYYDDIARLIGCHPTFYKLLTERPTAIWHAWFTSWQPLQWRLVGPGRLENAETKIEELYYTRHNGKYVNENNPLYGENKPGASAFAIPRALLQWAALRAILLKAKYVDGLNVGNTIADDLEDNLKYARADMKNGIIHSLSLGQDPADDLKEKRFVFSNRRAATSHEETAPENTKNDPE